MQTAHSTRAGGKKSKAAPKANAPIDRDPVENDVFVKDGRINRFFRRVIFVGSGRVCYSVGTTRNKWCDLDTFKKWMRTATLSHDGTKGGT